MFVCVCNQVTDKQIRCAVEEGVCSLEGLSSELKVGTCCGKCKRCAKKVMRDAMKNNAHTRSFPGGFTPALITA
ncbi:MAG: regulatory or redox protein complexing with Bfr, in iron storage and mobility [Gammaproteobacteria bacterium]|nr:MAG: regulatory or redox protein complexing with Bfr, in iron storage and mobility [Gammaproteobacteria bacterium]